MNDLTQVTGSDSKAQPQSWNALYQRVWRWHFYAGLLVAPIAVLLAITGAIYLFAPQINNALDHQLQKDLPALADTNKPTSLEHLQQTIEQNYPDSQLKQVILPRDYFAQSGLGRDRTVEFDIKTSGHSEHHGDHAHHHHHDHDGGKQKLRLTLDINSGELIHQQAVDSQLMRFVKKLHGELLQGDKGSLVVELAASWMLILIITGCYLYWPRQQQWWRPWFPQFRFGVNRRAETNMTDLTAKKVASARRHNLRQLHGATAAWASLAIVLLLLSGLPWTQVWGGAFKWAQDKLGVPDIGQEWFVTLQSGPQPQGQATPLNLSAVVQGLRGETLLPPVIVKPPRGDNGVWTVRSLHPNRANRVTIHYDRWTGQEKMRITMADKHWFKRLVSHGVSLHEGHLFGPLNQALGVLTALAVIAIAVTGPLMWWRRRPKGSWAAPPAPQGVVKGKVKGGLVALILLIAVLLPLAGLSIVAIAVLDGIIRRWLRARRRLA